MMPTTPTQVQIYYVALMSSPNHRSLKKVDWAGDSITNARFMPGLRFAGITTPLGVMMRAHRNIQQMAVWAFGRVDVLTA